MGTLMCSGGIFKMVIAILENSLAVPCGSAQFNARFLSLDPMPSGAR